MPRGSVIGLLGPSGSGKTTLMRSVVGVQVVAGGTVEVLGAAGGVAGAAAPVGYVTQAPSVYADLTVRENLRYFAAVLGGRRGDVDRVLDDVGLTDHADRCAAGSPEARGRGRAGRRPAERPGGAGARRADRRPRPGAAARPLGHVRAAGAAGVTLLVTSHVMDEASRCDRLLLLREGRLLSDSTCRAAGAHREPTIEQAFLRLVDEAAARGPRREAA